MVKSVNEWEQPLISVDVIPVRLDKTTHDLNIMLSERVNEPAIGVDALPGVLLTPYERVTEAAYRALKNKVGVCPTQVRLLTDVGVSDNPDRDPRGATMSVVFLAVIDPNTVPVSPVLKEDAIANVMNKRLPFDHNLLITKALTVFADKFLTERKLSEAVLGDVFTTKDVQAVQTGLTVIPGFKEENQSNLSRKLRLTKWVKEIKTLNETTTVASSLVRGPSIVDAQDIQSLTNSITSTSSGAGKRGRPSTSWVWEQA